jgi:hypothetical protein
MKGAAGISRPRRGPLPGSGATPLPETDLPVEYAPLCRKGLRAVRSPSLAAPLFANRRIFRSACMRLPPAPC